MRRFVFSAFPTPLNPLKWTFPFFVAGFGANRKRHHSSVKRVPFLYSGSLIICSGPKSPLGDLGVKITTCRGPTGLQICIYIGVEIKKEVML